MSQKWLNWWSVPDAGRLEDIACIAKPLMMRPSASLPVASTSPAATASGSESASLSLSWTNANANGSTASLPTQSAMIQSAPAGILAIRSAYPDADIPSGALAAMVGSSATPIGAGQSNVCLFPS